jgi:hypothetical protein
MWRRVDTYTIAIMTLLMSSPIIPIGQIRDRYDSFCQTSLNPKAIIFVDDRLADLAILRNALQPNAELIIVNHIERAFNRDRLKAYTHSFAPPNVIARLWVLILLMIR